MEKTTGKSTMLKIALTGCTGRMGQMLLKAANQNPDVDVVGALTRSGNLFVGQDAGTFIGEDPSNLFITASPSIAFQGADVVIDFSRPEGLESHLQEVLQRHKPFVICMTGLTSAHHRMLEEASQTIPLIIAPNTSLGIALLRKLAVLAADVLGSDYDVSLLEMHHRRKADAPSGTSLSIAHSLATLPSLRNNKPPYPSHSPRPRGTIECAVLRGGEVAGDHTVIFAGDKDMLTIEHRALNPALYAQGALRAAEWLASQPPGLYSMDDVIRISA
jgi:4-hydroxy-tetrahydrodipicolinate reductase